MESFYAIGHIFYLFSFIFWYMCEKSVSIIIYMYTNLRNCTIYIDFLCSILQIMYENTITLKFATAKKYGDWSSAKTDLFLP